MVWLVSPPLASGLGLVLMGLAAGPVFLLGLNEALEGCGARRPRSAGSEEAVEAPQGHSAPAERLRHVVPDVHRPAVLLARRAGTDRE